MYPVLIDFGPITIYTFGLFLGLAFFVFRFAAFKRLKELGLEEEKIFDLLILGSVVGVASSYLIYFLESFAFKTTSLWAGLIPFLLVVFYLSRRNKWDLWAILDELSFALCPFACLFYLGLFLDGSIIGRLTGMPWGVFFPGSLVRSHPVAIFAAFAFLLIWLILLRIERDWRTWTWYKSGRAGFVFFVFLILGLLTSFSLAFLTLNDLYYFVAKISLNGISLVVVIFYFLVHGQILWLRKNKKNKNETAKT